MDAVDGLFLKATIETRGPVPPESDPQMAGVAYRICLDARKPAGDCAQDSHADAIWTVQGGRAGGRAGRGGGAGPRYTALGTGALPASVKVEGNTISLEGSLPEGYKSGDQIYVSVAAQGGGQITVRHAVKLAGIAGPEVHLSSVKKDGWTVLRGLRIVPLPQAAARGRSDLHRNQGARR